MSTGGWLSRRTWINSVTDSLLIHTSTYKDFVSALQMHVLVDVRKRSQMLVGARRCSQVLVDARRCSCCSYCQIKSFPLQTLCPVSVTLATKKEERLFSTFPHFVIKYSIEIHAASGNRNQQKQLSRQDDGTSQIKVNPTQVRQEMPNPVQQQQEQDNV